MANSHFLRVADLHHLVMTALGTAGAALAVSDHIDWMRSRGLSDNTIHDRVRLLVRLHKWLLTQEPPKDLVDATPDDLARWQRSISRMATQSIATYVGHAAEFYRWRARFCGAPDVTGLLDRPKVPKGLPRPIPDQELSNLLRTTDGQMLVCLMLMAFCGLRVGEVARLQRHDIHDDDSPPIVVVHGKGNKHRIVRMPNDLGSHLRMAGLPIRGHIVSSPEGLPLSPNRLSQLVNAHLHDQGVMRTAHSLRHWYGTKTYRLTRDIRLVQEMLGHSSPTTTAVYAAFAPERADQMAAELDKTISALVGNRRGLRHIAGDH